MILTECLYINATMELINEYENIVNKLNYASHVRGHWFDSSTSHRLLSFPLPVAEPLKSICDIQPDTESDPLQSNR